MTTLLRRFQLTLKPTGKFVRETLATSATVLALTAVATMGTGCGVFTQENAVKISGHVSDAAGMSEAQKTEIQNLTKQAHQAVTGAAPAQEEPAPATDKAEPKAPPAPETSAKVAGDWIDNIARLVALFGDQKSSNERAEN